MENVFIMEHPLIKHKISRLRDKKGRMSFVLWWKRLQC